MDRELAVRIITLLRSGANCLEAAEVFSGGRNVVYRAAEDLFEDIELTDGAAVRWIKGAYGSGKTHSFARLMEIARRRGWVYSYVQVSGRGMGVEIHKFEQILSSVFQGLTIPQSRGALHSIATHDGWSEILDGWIDSLRRQAGARPGQDVQSMIFDQALATSMIMLQAQWGIHGVFAAALRQYAIASRDNDLEWRQQVREWFSGADVLKMGPEVKARFRGAGILQIVNRAKAKEILRQMSAFVRFRGYRGTLILLDEVENVLLQTPAARRASYTILRELIDNVDDQHGMRSTMFYASGTPDLFDAQTGMLEYEALAARVLPPSPNATPNPAAVVLDLARYPIKRNDLLIVGNHIARVYELARNLKLPCDVGARIESLADRLSSDADQVSPRLWVRSVVDELDRANSAAQAGVAE